MVKPCREQAQRLQPESGLQARGGREGSVPLCACPVRAHTHTCKYRLHTQKLSDTDRQTHRHIYTHIQIHTQAHTKYIHTQKLSDTHVHKHTGAHTHKYTHSPPAPTHRRTHTNTHTPQHPHTPRPASTESLPERPIISSAGADPGKAGNAGQGGWAAWPAVWPPGSGSGV